MHTIMPDTTSTSATRTANLLDAVRRDTPLVHNITNFVVMNNSANALLAIGASPAMVHALDEVEDFVALAQALVINIGTLSPDWVAAMKLAADRAGALGIPWVLDPVGAGATPYRSRAAMALAARAPAVIRGNASEIRTLAREEDAQSRGPDSLHSSDTAVAAARRLARDTGAVVAVTGEVDYVTDGDRLMAVRNGHPLMARVTGLGCTASALVAAFLAVADDRVEAAVAALTVLGVAGELAAARAAGPGSLQVTLLDALYRCDRATLEAHVRA